MRIRNAIMPIASVATLIIAAYTVVRAYCTNCIPPGAPVDCQTQAITTLRGGMFGGGRTLVSTGQAHFVVMSTTQEPTASSSLQFQGFTGTGTDPELGTFVWTGNMTRATPFATIVSNQPGEDFPATGNIYMQIDVTVGGAVYRSMGVVHVLNDHLQTFAPHLNEVYNLTQEVNFEDVANPGEVAFTLAGLTATLN